MKRRIKVKKSQRETIDKKISGFWLNNETALIGFLLHAFMYRLYFLTEKVLAKRDDRGPLTLQIERTAESLVHFVTDHDEFMDDRIVPFVMNLFGMDLKAAHGFVVDVFFNEESLGEGEFSEKIFREILWGAIEWVEDE